MFVTHSTRYSSLGRQRRSPDSCLEAVFGRGRQPRRQRTAVLLPDRGVRRLRLGVRQPLRENRLLLGNSLFATRECSSVGDGTNKQVLNKKKKKTTQQIDNLKIGQERYTDEGIHGMAVRPPLLFRDVCSRASVGGRKSLSTSSLGT